MISAGELKKGMTLELDSALYQVVETPPGFKRDTAASGTKPARLETGVTVGVPLFINPNQKIMVDTRTGQYLERA